MKPTVYIETTIVSYLTAWPSRDIVRLSHEILTRQWWSNRNWFELYTSKFVIEEASGGDATAAAERLRALAGIPLLAVNAEAIALAQELAALLKLPERATADALHIAVAAQNGISFLLTWNCRHLANANFVDKIEQTCNNFGLLAPRIVTPNLLLEAP